MLFQDRRGISEMIGYILLITIGIAMSVLVFTWLKGYVPKESVECSEGVSLFIKDYTYDCASDKLTLTLKNNGRFSVTGFLIHATTEEGQELATNDMSLFFDADGDGLTDDNEINDEPPTDPNNPISPPQGIPDGGIKINVWGGEIKFSNTAPNQNTFSPSTGTESLMIEKFILADLENKKIEIVPTRHETVNEKPKLATCTKAKISQDIACRT